MFTLATGGTIQGVAGTNNVLNCTVFGMELSGGVETYKVLVQALIANSVGIIGSYTVAASTIAIVRRIQIANTTGSAVTGLILYINGTAAGNQITGSMTIPANGTMVMTDAGTMVYDSNGNLFSSGAAFATPALTLGTANAAGASVNGMRSDATIAALDSTAVNATTPLALSTAGVAVLAARRDHTHQSPGGVAAITSNSGTITTVDTSVVSATIPANFLLLGTTIKVKVFGTCTSSVGNTPTFVLRIGANNNNTDTALVTVTATAATSGTNIPFYAEFYMTVRGTGSGQAVAASGFLYNSTQTGISTNFVATGCSISTAGTVTTTVQNFLNLFFVGAATTSAVFQLAEIEVIKM
jgi:hypothetical protein